MAGQGITVSILAKIEGWLDLIKLIQNAMKNIKPGADISKGLAKDLQLVNDMVNNLGKNMNLRLTSDSLITGFVDKIMLVEEVFNRLGTSMSHISFGDIKPEYITAGFKDLLSTLELANNALGQGMESSFQNAIANSKTLLKEFARMKIDPKTMNIEGVREALAERGKALEKDVNDGLKKLTDFEKGLEKLKNTRDELAARDKFLGKDANATAQSLLIGHQLPTKGTILDADELDKQVSFFRSNLLKAGFTPTQLNHIIPDLETVMKAGHWDEMPSKFAEYLREAQNRTKNSLTKASADYKDAVLEHQRMVGAQNRLSSSRFNNTLAQNEVSQILSGTVLNDTKSLRDVVNNLKQQLELAVTSGFKGLGGKLFNSSLQGMQDASAAMKDYSAALDQVKAKELAVSKVLGVVLRYFSIYAAVRMVSRGIRSMMNNIKELDKTITEIAIVTKMDQNDLWGLMPQYTKLAKNYAASISGVYKVSQLYYQQGLGQLDVMALTELTLKMARISGLDYAEATDYMTNAVRSFKMEMTDAATVVDVYSAVAASSASSVTELATAMSKTASSAAAVGSSFENTTAMLAVMIEATRESPENIGSAMKSIISRYGELKENKTGIDEEGEAYSLNKVDKALLTVGISIHDANGEFRDFDDVIFELAEKWNTIDKNTLRYIATVMAGNRQQSRFLALVSSTERLKEESEKAANSEDASQLQFLKTMDSIEAKTQLFLTSLQSLYTSSGLENLYKGLLDFGNEFATTLENISSKHGLVGAISNVGASFVNMATFATTGFNLIKSRFLLTRNLLGALNLLDTAKANLADRETSLENIKANAITKLYQVYNTATGKTETIDTGEYTEESQRLIEEAENSVKNAREEVGNAENSLLVIRTNANKMAKLQGWGMAASAAGMALSAWSNTIDINENRGLKSGLTMGGSALLGLGTGLMVGATAGGPIGALVGVLTALPGILLGAGMLTESTAERILKLEKNITEAKNEKIQSKDELKTLEDYKKKYDELSKSLYESAEKKKEFMELSNSIAASYPELIKSMDAEGNYVINMAEGYERLAKAKREAYKEDIITEMGATISGLEDIDYILKNVYGKNLMTNNKFLLDNVDLVEDLLKIDYTQSTDIIRSAVRDKLNYGAISLIDERGGNTADRLFLTDGKSLIGNLIFPNYNADDVTDIYMALFELAQLKMDLVIAKENVKSQFEGKYDDLIESFDTNFYDELLLRLLIPDILKDLVNNRMSGYTAEYINLIADSADAVFNTESTDLTKRFAKTLLQDEWNKEYDKLKKRLDAGETIDWSTEISNFYKSHEEIWYNLLLESDELKGIDSLAEEFYKALGLHTKKDIENLFPKVDESDLEGEALEAALKNNEIAEKRRAFFRKIYEEDYDNIINNYNNWLKDEDITKFKVNDYSDKVGADYLTQIQSQYKNIISNTGLSEKLIADQVAALNDITDFITSLDLDFDTRNTLLTKYSAADLTSLNGIYNFVDTLSNLDIDLDLTSLITKVQSLGDVLAVNFEAEIDSYYSAIESSVTDFNKAVKSVTEGTDLKTAREIADKMGKSLSEFDVKDGKFYFDDIEALREAYIKENDLFIEDTKKNVKNRYTALLDLKEVTLRDKDGKPIEGTAPIEINGEQLLSGLYETDYLNKLFSTESSKLGFLESTGISYTEFIKYYDSFKEQINTGTSDFVEFMLLLVDTTLSDSGEAIIAYMTLNTATALLKAGDIKGFLKTTGVMKSDKLLLEEAENIINNDNEKLTQAREAANEARQQWLNDIEKKKKNTDIDAIKKELYDARTAEGWTSEEDLKKLAQEIAESNKFSNESIYLEFLDSDIYKRSVEDYATWRKRYFKEHPGFAGNEGFLELRYLDDLKIALEEREAWLEENLLPTDLDKIIEELKTDTPFKTDAKILKEAQAIQSLRKKDNAELMANAPEVTTYEQWKETLTEEEKKQLEKDEERAYSLLIYDIGHGQVDNLPDNLREYASTIYLMYNLVTNNIMSGMMTALKDGEKKVGVTKENLSVLEDFLKLGLVKRRYQRDENGNIKHDDRGFALYEALEEGDLAEYDIEALKSMSDEKFMNLVEGLNKDRTTKEGYLKDYFDIKYPDPSLIASKMITSSDYINRDELNDLYNSLRKDENETDELIAKRLDLEVDAYGATIKDRNAYIAEILEQINTVTDPKLKRKLLADLQAALRENDHADTIDTYDAVLNLLKDTKIISEDARKALAGAITDDLAKKYFEDNLDGTYTLNTAQLRNDIFDSTTDIGKNIGEKLKEQLLESFALLGDTAIQASEDAVKLVTSGTNKLQDMQKVVNAFKGKYTLAELFTYDEILNAYTLDPAYLREYLEILAKDYAAAMGISEKLALDIVSKQTLETLASQIDIDSFLLAESRGEGSLARLKLAKELKALYVSKVPDHISDAAKQSYLDAADLTVENRIKALEGGGQDAIKEALEIAKELDKELSSDQIEEYYYSEINRLQGFSDKIAELTEGSYVADGEFKDILTSVGMIDSLGLVTNLTNAAQAYKAIYEQMGKTGEQTAASLNKVYAQYLTESERGDIDAISTMGDAMGMAYETLGLILGREGENLQEWLLKPENQGMFERVGAGKIRITDFTSFAALRGWQPGSEEYTSAFKSYNDSLIEVNLQVKLSILDEVKSIENVRGGEQLNLTLLYTELGKKAIAWTTETVNVTEKGYEGLTKTTSKVTETLLSKLQKRLAKRNATFINGILTLEDDANLLGIILDVSNAADTLGMNLGIELLDMVHSILQSYTEAITKGIEGGMTNIEAADLLVKAKNLGLVENLSFTETAEGLKLSQESAIQLYYALLATDVLQGQLTFDKLRENLEANNLNYKNANTVLAHIRNLNKKIANELGKYNDEQLKSYKQELMLAEQIASVHSGDKDSSWNFMNNEEAIPGTFDNAFTYIDDVASAVNFLTDASSNGIVELKGFLPILKHISELAKEAGGSIDFMGASVNENTYDEFLKQAWSMAEWDLKTGKVTISTKTLLNSVFGFDFSKGGEGLPIEWMSSHLMEGLNVITELRAEFYDNLHDMGIAAEKDLSNINAIFGENLDIKKLKEYINTNTEFGNAFTGLVKNIKIGEKSLIDFITAGENLDSSSPAYKAIKGIMELTLFDDYDSSRGYADIIEHMALAGIEGEYTLDDIIYSILGKKVLQKPKDDKGWTFEGSDQSYPTSEAAFAAMNNKEAQEFVKTLKQIGKTQEDNTFIIDDNVFYLQYDEKLSTFKITDNNGKEYPDYETFINTEYDNYVQEIGSEALSLEAWQIKLGLIIVPTLESLNGTLNNTLLTALRLAGLNTAEKLQAAWDASPLEFEAKYGINLTPKDGKVINWDAIAHLILSDEMAMSVQTGITNAFTSGNITEALSTGLASAFANTEGLNIPELKINPLAVTTDGEITVEPISEALGTITHLIAKATTIEADGTITGVEITGELDGKPVSVKIDKEGALGDINEIKKAIMALSPLSITVTIPEPDASPITNAINGLGNLTKDVTINPIIGSIWTSLFGGGSTEAKGNVGLANAKGTLMGELGPELVVSKGHYFVVGQSGPEMIDLADDAIVFNHLQTQSLLSKGMSNTRGKAITNERKAVAYATGSRHGGPAHEYTGVKSTASTSEAGQLIRGIDDPKGILLKVAKQTKSSGDEATKDLKAFVKEFERWYNWLQKIAHLEKVISLEEAKRTRYSSDFIRSGKDYYNSLLLSLSYLKLLVAVQRDLNNERRKYNETLRQQLNDSPYSLMYTFDENFLPRYKEGMYEFVSELLGQDFTTNEANNDINAIYDKLVSMGFENMMQYDSSGNKIDLEKDGGKNTAVLTIVEMMEKRNELALKAHDEEIDGEAAVEELLNSENEIFKDIEDNQIEVENKVLNAMVDAREREIEELRKLRDAIEKGNLKLVDGLNKLLEQERTMYENLKNLDELTQLQRRLAILLRSGGSASEIADLQLQISDKQYDNYFSAQELQIQAILDASDLLLERLDNLIEIMEETLDYEKLHGLLWELVHDILLKSPEEIAAYIQTNDSSYWDKSLPELNATIREDLFKLDRYKEFLESTGGDITVLKDRFIEYVDSLAQSEQETVEPSQVETAASDTGDSGGGGGSDNSNNNNGNNNNKKFYNVLGLTFNTKEEAEEYLQTVKKETKGAHGATSEVKEVTIKSSKWQYDDSKHWKLITYSDDTTSKTDEGPHNFDKKTGACICGYKKAMLGTIANTNTDNNKHEIGKEFTKDGKTYQVQPDGSWKLVKKARGGYVNHGLYELGELGTETVLNASLTRVLHDNILSNRPESLINLLKSYNESYHNVLSFWDRLDRTKAEMNDNYGSVVIEHAEVNLQIDELANDYDARHAANTVMDELLLIARKTSASNRVGRR